jgi:hypothetical protein
MDDTLVGWNFEGTNAKADGAADARRRSANFDIDTISCFFFQEVVSEMMCICLGMYI